MKSRKIIDDKISQRRNKGYKQAYLAQFCPTKWSKTKQLRQNLHSVQNCKCCKSFHASLSEKFPESKKNKIKISLSLGKLFNEVLLAVPQLNIQGKQSPNERKQQRLKKNGNSKPMLKLRGKKIMWIFI